MDLQHFKDSLLVEKESLEKEIKSYTDKDPYFDNRQSESYDDDISEMEGHDRVVVTAGQLKVDLEKVDAALKKVEDGSFGKCENCGAYIDPARLEAMPTAALCNDCQNRETES